MTDDRASVARETNLATWLLDCFRDNEADLKGLTVEEVSNAFADAKADALHIMEWPRCEDCEVRQHPKMNAGTEDHPLCDKCRRRRRDMADAAGDDRAHAAMEPAAGL